jgi:4-hydroxy-3-methylbut-2-en-1-yl diphosphate synthase IspG/GcpE
MVTTTSGNAKVGVDVMVGVSVVVGVGVFVGVRVRVGVAVTVDVCVADGVIVTVEVHWAAVEVACCANCSAVGVHAIRKTSRSNGRIRAIPIGLSLMYLILSPHRSNITRMYRSETS